MSRPAGRWANRAPPSARTFSSDNWSRYGATTGKITSDGKGRCGRQATGPARQGLDDALLYRELDEFGAILETKRLHELVLVEFDRPGRDFQNGGDLLDATSFGEQLEDLALAGGELGQGAALARGLLFVKLQEFAGKQGRDVSPSLQGAVDRGDELRRSGMLQDLA